MLFGDAGDDKQYGWNGNDRVYGGPGDDECWGAEGGDIHFLFFGSDDIVRDEAGDDTLDASEVASAITIDLDLQDAVQVVDAAGNTLRLEGQFENFVGGPFDDVVFADPLTAPRSIDGGSAPPTAALGIDGAGVQGEDILNFDAQGFPVTDNGATLTVVGFATVSYSNFATVNITNTIHCITPDCNI